MKNGEIQALLYLTYMEVVLKSGPNFLFSNIMKTCWEPDEMKWNKLNSSSNNFSPLRAALKHSFSSNEYIHYILWSLQYIVHTSMYVNVMMMSWNKTCSISFIFYHQAAIFITLMKIRNIQTVFRNKIQKCWYFKMFHLDFS